MAPELLAGKSAGAQSDIYSLSVVLYQFVVGDFSRPLTVDWSSQVQEDALREDLARCFAGNPAARFAKAGELAASLRALDERRAQRLQRDRKSTRLNSSHQ